MAYILGYIYADGTLINTPYNRGQYLQITSTDKDSVKRIKEWMDSEHILTTNKSSWKHGKTQYIFKVGSHKIYTDLLKLGLYPNKSLTIKFPKIPKKYLWHFIRGYFDGDGCIYFEKGNGKHGQPIIKRIRVIFTSGSKDFLNIMDGVLKQYGLTKGKIYFNQRAFQLKYPNDDSIRIFKLMYSNTSNNSFFMRKFNIFRNYFELKPIHIDKTIGKILVFHKNGLVAKTARQSSAKASYGGANPPQAS